MSFRTLSAGFLVFVCFVAALDMGAVTMRPMSLADLVRESDLAFEGNHVRSRARNEVSRTWR